VVDFRLSPAINRYLIFEGTSVAPSGLNLFLPYPDCKSFPLTRYLRYVPRAVAKGALGFLRTHTIVSTLTQPSVRCELAGIAELLSSFVLSIPPST